MDKPTYNKPKYKFKAGAISATVWINTTKKTVAQKTIDVQYPTIVIERNYKDKNDNWQTTNHFGLSELPDVIAVTNEAYNALRVRGGIYDAVLNTSDEESTSNSRLDDLEMLKDLLERHNLNAVPKK